MKMSEKRALDISTQIVVAVMQNSNIPPSSDSGKCVADFFEAIYKGISSIETSFSVE